MLKRRTPDHRSSGRAIEILDELRHHPLDFGAGTEGCVGNENCANLDRGEMESPHRSSDELENNHQQPMSGVALKEGASHEASFE